MRHLFKDKEHLVRFAALLAGGAILFLLMRAALVPKGFGEYGHYRSGALVDVAVQPISFAGRAACADCHGDMADKLHGGKHAGVGCEACHGPLANHAEDPAKAKAVKPEPRALCPVCHMQNAAKPKGFPQVNVKDHAEGASCKDCHDPHHPDA
jgi:hypothetical protein